MKIFIVGKHCSGKHECLNKCEELGCAVGREFSNLPEPLPTIYIDPQYLRYPTEDINQLYDNCSYITIGGIEERGVTDAYMYHRGLSHYTYDNSQVMAIQSSQVESINKRLIKDDILFVWLDSTRDSRIRRHASESRTYDFVEQEEIESKYDADFVKSIYNFPNSSILYFNCEDPARVATIITAIVKYPDLKDIFIENFN